jgi:DNA-binding transcriptional LysR family regulator
MRAAADALNVAASSISRQLSKLEAELDIELFEKGRHKFELTEAGKIVNEFYSKRLTEHEALVAELEDLRVSRKGHIEIAIGEGLIGEILTPCLLDFERSHPNIYVSIKMRSSTSELVSAIVADEAHFALAFDIHDEPRIRKKVSIPQPLKAIVNPSHELANKPYLKLADILEQQIILLDDHNLLEVIDSAEQLESIHVVPILTTNSISLLKDCVKNSNYLTIISDISMADALRNGDVVSVPINNAATKKSSVHLVTRLGRRLPSSAQKLLKIVEQELLLWYKKYSKLTSD